MPADPRIVYGARCTWWDGIGEAGVGLNKLPCCPHCAGPLYVAAGPAEWWAGVDQQHDTDGHPGYRAAVEWARGRCFPTEAAMLAAYEARRAGPDLGGDGSLNLPYEDVPGGPVMVDDEFTIVTGLTYRSGTCPSPLTGEPMAVVILDAYTPSGARLTPLLLLLEDADLLAFPDDLRKTVRAARRAAGRG